MEAVSSLAESQARFAAQASMIAIQNAIEAQQRLAEMLAEQARQVQPAESSSGTATNPPHLGQHIDTYA